MTSRGPRTMGPVRAVVAALLVGGTLGCATTEPAVKPPPPPPDDGAEGEGGAEPAGSFYEVRPGDTLFSIAKKHQVSVEDIAEVNGIVNPAELAVGQIVFVPDDGLALPSDPEPVVVVEEAPSTTTSALSWPLDEGIILRDFDRARALDGMILAAPKGTPVLAAADGEVVFTGDEGQAYGRMVMVRHAQNLLTIYAHLDTIVVEKGARVRAREKLGTVGETGRAESPQLHFQVRAGREPVNPLSHLPPAE